MKNLSITALSLISVLFTVSCVGPRNNKVYNDPPGDITMEIVPPTVDANTSVVTLMVTNHSRETAQFGANYTIEKYDRGSWSEFERPDFAVIAIMYILQPGQTESYEINLFPDQSDYSPGLYRIVKSIYLDLSGPGYYTAEFHIK